jgi:phage-related protein (TIGR01555 family)
MSLRDVLFGPREQFRPAITDFAPPAKPKMDLAGFARAAQAAAAREQAKQAPVPPAELFAPAEPPPGVGPKDRGAIMAMDDAFSEAATWAGQNVGPGWFGQRWPGFAALSELAQRVEYRMISEAWAEEMTRKWITITYEGEDDQTAKVQAIEEEFKRLAVRDVFYDCVLSDGFLGRSHLFIDTGNDSPAELATPLVMDKAKIKKKGIKAIKMVEAVWVYPAAYNTTKPLAQDYYKPRDWYVMRDTVHHTRLRTICARPVPDILKAAYSFGGVSLSQLAMPYVNYWLRNRTSVGDIINAFSIMILATDLAALTENASGADMINRFEAMTALRDNMGLQVLNKGTEEFSNVSAPLGTLDALLAQSQEHMASAAALPLVKFTGVTPAGLNASSDGEIRVFYDRVDARFERWCGPHLRAILNLVQISLFGEIDPGIGYKFNPLWALDEAGKANVWKTRVDGRVELIASGVVDPEEARKAEAEDEDSPFFGLEGPPPEPEDDDEDQPPRILPDPAKGLAEPGAERRSGV